MKSDSRRQGIMDFLMEAGTATVEDLATRFGVSKMTVYRHFGSKEALFAGVITDLCERIVDGDLREIFELPPREGLWRERLLERELVARERRDEAAGVDPDTSAVAQDQQAQQEGQAQENRAPDAHAGTDTPPEQHV